MIIGTGADITDIRRMEKALKQFGSRFEQRIFTKKEQQKARSRTKAGQKAIASTYAKRFAAKEACAKALGTGMRSGVSWQDIEIINDDMEKPCITLHAKAAEIAAKKAKLGETTHIHLALSDEYPYAYAHVIIESVPQ